jgi:hypothetical protein
MADKKESEMATNDAGKNIMLAFQVVTDTYRQADALLARLDEALRKKKLFPSQKRKVADNQTARLGSADRWIPVNLYREYSSAERGSSKPIDQVITFEIILRPDDAEEPVLAVAALELRQKISVGQIWSAWVGSLAHAIDLEAGLDATEPMDVAEEDLEVCFDGATKGRALAIRLCDITEDNLEKLVVEPVLALIKHP